MAIFIVLKNGRDYNSFRTENTFCFSPNFIMILNFGISFTSLQESAYTIQMWASVV